MIEAGTSGVVAGRARRRGEERGVRAMPHGRAPFLGDAQHVQTARLTGSLQASSRVKLATWLKPDISNE
jgi:hypothetical protein